MRNYSISIVLMAILASENADAVLFNTSDIKTSCEGTQNFTVPKRIQGKFWDHSSSGWIEVSETGISRADWQGFNFLSQGGSLKNFCVRHEIVTEDPNFITVKMSLERKESGLITSKELYYMAVILHAEANEVFATTGSSTSMKFIGLIPFMSASTILPKEVPLSKDSEKRPNARLRNISSER